MELYGVDSNLIPDGAVVGEIMASDGIRLRYARWKPTVRRTLGTVCLFQGRAEAVEKYYEVVGDLRRRGFAVATFDWRGQGISDRRLRNRNKGHIDGFEEYDRDFDAFMQQVALPDCPPPHFALAHSTGALICLRAVREGRMRFTRMVLSSPLLGLAARRPSQRLVYATAAMITAIGFGELDLPQSKSRAIVRTHFESNPLTSDPDRFARTVETFKQNPKLGIGAPTWGWLYAACKAMAEVSEPDFAPSIGVPILMLAGMRDPIVSVSAIEAFVEELRAGALSIVPGGLHELMMERDSLREQFWAAFDAFVPGS